MEIAVKQPTFSPKNIETSAPISITGKFTKFANSMEDYRILLLSFMLIFQGCILVPVTLLTVSFIDIGLGGISVGLLAVNTLGVLVTNMAEAPIKTILFTFIFSTLSSLALIAIHLLSI